MSPTEFTHSPVIPIAAPFDLTDYPELAGIEAITGTGLVARTGTGTYATRTIAVPAAGITISNAGGVAGNPTLALANDLAALEALSSTGIAVRSTTDTWVQRTITGTTNQVNVSNGDGVSGNPTLSTPQNIHTAATPRFAGIGLGTTYSNGRIQIVSGTTSADGIFWGTDTNLYRSAANTLKTDDSLVVSSGLSVSTLTTGSIPYIGAGGAIGDNNANLFWNNGGTALLIRSNSIGTNGALQVNGTVGVGSSGTNYIRPITNADGVSLILLATQVVVGNVNSDAYSYSGGGRLAVVTNTDSHTLLDVGRNASTNARFKVVNTISGQAYTTFENSTTTAFRSFTSTGETIFGASSLTTGEGRIHVAPHTTKAGGLYFGAANTNLYSSAGGALKTDGVLTIAGTTASSSSTTGALIVSGGVGIAKALYVASDLVVTPTASATRWVTITGSNGGNPTISTSAGSLAITPAIVCASTLSALAITGNSFIPNAATVPTNGMYLEAANNPAFAANSTKIFEYDSTGIQISGTITTTGGATFHTTSTALTNGAGVAAGTLTNAPVAGDPTKWIGINDNGTTRYIPAW